MCSRASTNIFMQEAQTGLHAPELSIVLIGQPFWNRVPTSRTWIAFPCCNEKVSRLKSWFNAPIMETITKNWIALDCIDCAGTFFNASLAIRVLVDCLPKKSQSSACSIIQICYSSDCCPKFRCSFCIWALERKLYFGNVKKGRWLSSRLVLRTCRAKVQSIHGTLEI